MKNEYFWFWPHSRGDRRFSTMNNQPDQDHAFAEPEEIPEANFAIAGPFLIFVRLTSRASIGYWTSSFMDTLVSQT